MANLDSSLTELKSNYAEKCKNLEEHNNTVLRKVKMASIILLPLLAMQDSLWKSVTTPLRLDL